jgi:hypothetical protein
MIVVEPSHSLSTAKLHVFSQNRKKIPMNIVLGTNKKQLEQNRTKDICLRRNVNYLRQHEQKELFLSTDLHGSHG